MEATSWDTLLNFLDSLEDIAVIWLPVILLCICGFFLQKAYISSLLAVGGRALMLVPASFCVPLHELSHLLTAKLFGHKIEKVVFFQMNSTSTLGYVQHSWTPTVWSPFTNMIIGLSPIAGSIFVMVFITNTIFGEWAVIDFPADTKAISIDSLFALADNAVKRVVELYHYSEIEAFALWLFLVANITVFGFPSAADFRGAAKGIICTALVYVAWYSYDTGIQQIVDHAILSLICLWLLALSSIALITGLLQAVVLLKKALTNMR